MKDAGHAIEWRPGRHGPGDNAFNDFVGPFGEVINTPPRWSRSTAATSPAAPPAAPGRRAAGPPGRVNAWGISPPPSARLKAAQRAVFFMPSA